LVSDENQRVALLPIQPRYVRDIIEGGKRVEFRRRAFAKPVSHAVIYATSPYKRVVAHFRVAHITQATPGELWRRFADVAGIDYDTFRHYYSGAREGIAIGIADLVILAKPVPLSRISPSLAAPQSFCYLEKGLFAKVMELALR